MLRKITLESHEFKRRRFKVTTRMTQTQSESMGGARNGRRQRDWRNELENIQKGDIVTGSKSYMTHTHTHNLHQSTYQSARKTRRKWRTHGRRSVSNGVKIPTELVATSFALLLQFPHLSHGVAKSKLNLMVLANANTLYLQVHNNHITKIHFIMVTGKLFQQNRVSFTAKKGGWSLKGRGVG